ncbi:MAG: HYR domain-containing protein, partial [Verrucomicrobiota bacterium]
QPNNTGMATATGYCSTNTMITWTDVTNCVCPVRIVRTWTAIDGCTNIAQCDQIIRITDAEVPTITCSTNLHIVAPFGSVTAAVSFTVVASDTIDPTPDIFCTPPSGSTFSNGTTTVHCVAIDNCGNSNICSFTVEVTGWHDLTLIDDTNGWGSIAGATSGTYMAGSAFDLTAIPINHKYGLLSYDVNGAEHTNANLHLELTADTTVRVAFTDLFIDVSDDVNVTATNWTLDFDTGIMYSDLEICNVSTVDVHLIAPFWYLFPSNGTQFLLNIDGHTNGTPYIDVTEQVTNALPMVGNHDNALDTNECVTITNIAWYQLRSVPFDGSLIAGFFADPPVEAGGDTPGLRDTDGDGLFNAWEQKYGLNPNHARDAGEDPDRDGETNFEEFLADTDPGRPNSFLRILSVEGASGGASIQWAGGRDVYQYIECAPSPTGPWTAIFTNIPPTSITGWLHHATGVAPFRMYRIRVDRRPASPGPE